MSAPPTAGPDLPARPAAGHHPATPAQLRWLEHQLGEWSAEGVVDAVTAAAIRSRYTAHRRFTLARIVLTLGASFVGLGLIWLVAANLDAMSPLARFLLMTAVWLGLVVASEVLAVRRERRHDSASPVVGALRLLAGGAFGAVVFQAAQSLQVPAYEPLLVGVWGLGVLVWAYAVRGLLSVVLGVGLLAFWFVWQVVEAAGSLFSASTALGAAGAAAVAVGVLHGVARRGGGWPEAGVPWREVGAVLVLAGLFVAALPYGEGGTATSWVLWLGVGVAALLLATAVLVGDRLDRLEAGLAGLALAFGVALSLWRYDVAGVDTLEAADLGVGGWARALLAVALYLGVASAYAVLGGLRDSDRMTWLATVALVLFTTVQAFAVFAPVLSGAALFLLVGVVLLATGVLADRGRRRLVPEAREVLS